MKFYVDEKGNRYSVDHETGKRTLIEPAAQPKGASVSDPKKTADEKKED
jgi:hypothetical protein